MLLPPPFGFTLPQAAYEVLAHHLLLVFLIYTIFFSATKVYIDDVLTCRAWKRDSIAKKKLLSSYKRRFCCCACTG